VKGGGIVARNGFRFFFTFCLLLIIGGRTALATSWAEIEPMEVSKRAEVIVKGTYDFSSEPKKSGWTFRGYKFYVNQVFRGDVPKQIVAGIDSFDVGWAEEFQSKGGEFLLLLEKNEKVDFLVPVGGPNGMVQVVDGKVKSHKDGVKGFYEDLLKAKANTSGDELELNEERHRPMYLMFYSIIGIMAAVAVLRLAKRYW